MKPGNISSARERALFCFKKIIRVCLNPWENSVVHVHSQQSGHRGVPVLNSALRRLQDMGTVSLLWGSCWDHVKVGVCSLSEHVLPWHPSRLPSERPLQAEFDNRVLYAGSTSAICLLPPSPTPLINTELAGICLLSGSGASAMAEDQ